MFKVTKVFLDTNFLLIPGSFGLDVFSELVRIVDFNARYCVLSTTLDELQGIIDKGGKPSFNAKLGYIMAHQKLDVVKSKGHVDDALVAFAKKGAVICTQDKALKERVKQAGAKVVTMRSKRKLVFV